MTKGGVIASEAKQSQEKQNSKIKRQNDRAKIKKQSAVSQWLKADSY